MRSGIGSRPEKVLLTEEDVLHALGFPVNDHDAFEKLKKQGLPVAYPFRPGDPRVEPSALREWTYQLLDREKEARQAREAHLRECKCCRDKATG